MKTTLTAALALAALCACSSGPRGRIMGDADQDYVGNRAAGAAAFDRLISESVDRLLRDVSAARGGLGKLRIVTLPVENASSEELGDWQEQVYELIDTSINRADRYEMISRRFVDAALRELRMRPDQLFIPKNQRAMKELLESQGHPVDAYLFPKLTSGTTAAGDGIIQRNYLLNLELVDLETGRSTKVSSKPLRKEYQD